MARYTGLPESLRKEIFARDRYRCRWCGRTDAGLDIHHIEYRRGISYDVPGNLISLCRAHHSFVHGLPDANRTTITKSVAQKMLFAALETPGAPGIALWRAAQRRWDSEGLCVHGEDPDTCPDCLRSASMNPRTRDR